MQGHDLSYKMKSTLLDIDPRIDNQTPDQLTVQRSKKAKELEELMPNIKNL